MIAAIINLNDMYLLFLARLLGGDYLLLVVTLVPIADIILGCHMYEEFLSYSMSTMKTIAEGNCDLYYSKVTCRDAKFYKVISFVFFIAKSYKDQASINIFSPPQPVVYPVFHQKYTSADHELSIHTG